jgi:type VI protein secretion system component Hcp
MSRHRALSVFLGGLVGIGAAACGDARLPSPSATATPLKSGVYTVQIQASTPAAVPACSAKTSGETAFVTSSNTLESCLAGVWVPITCVIGGNVAFDSATDSLWACTQNHDGGAAQWAQITLPQGPQGPAGATGATGAMGNTGAESLALATAIGPGTACAAGGQEVQIGVDTNSDGLLEEGEVQQTAFICNGVAGDAGATGPAGPPGPPGPSGPPGAASAPPAGQAPIGDLAGNLGFVRFTGATQGVIQGGSTAPGFAGWSVLTGFGLSESNPPSGAGVGVGVGRASFDPVGATLVLDRGSLGLTQAAQTGESLTQVEFAFETAGAAPFVFFQVTLENARLVNLATSSLTGSGAAQESLALVFESIALQFNTQNPDGTAGPVVNEKFDLNTNTLDIAQNADVGATPSDDASTGDDGGTADDASTGDDGGTADDASSGDDASASDDASESAPRPRATLNFVVNGPARAGFDVASSFTPPQVNNSATSGSGKSAAGKTSLTPALVSLPIDGTVVADLQNTFSGRAFPSSTVDVFEGSGDASTGSTSYTFENATITSFTLTGLNATIQFISATTTEKSGTVSVGWNIATNSSI